MTEAPLDPIEEEKQALDRFARTADGHLVHRYLRRVLEAVYDTPDAGALSSHNGRRTLARDLMRLMAQGIEDTRGRHAQSDSADRAILTGAAGPAHTRRARGAGRRVTADTLVAGWNVTGDGVDKA